MSLLTNILCILGFGAVPGIIFGTVFADEARSICLRLAAWCLRLAQSADTRLYPAQGCHSIPAREVEEPGPSRTTLLADDDDDEPPAPAGDGFRWMAAPASYPYTPLPRGRHARPLTEQTVSWVQVPDRPPWFTQTKPIPKVPAALLAAPEPAGVVDVPGVLTEADHDAYQASYRAERDHLTDDAGQWPAVTIADVQAQDGAQPVDAGWVA